MVRPKNTPSTANGPDVFARNLLLRSLTLGDHALLVADMEPVILARGEVLFEPGEDVTSVTFPLDGTVTTLLVPLADGRTIESATVGREGALGGVVSQGHLPAFNRAVVQIGGAALRISARRLQEIKQTSPTLRNAVTRYADCLLAQVLQSVACNATHSIEQRSARWLLTLQDRLGIDELPITQEVLADMLGVRRSYLCGVLRSMQTQGLVANRRRCVTVLDRSALEGAACECYERVRTHFEDVLGAHYRPDGKLVAVAPLTEATQAPRLMKASA